VAVKAPVHATYSTQARTCIVAVHRAASILAAATTHHSHLNRLEHVATSVEAVTQNCAYTADAPVPSVSAMLVLVACASLHVNLQLSRKRHFHGTTEQCPGKTHTRMQPGAA
jgi:hypothetical protein